MMLPRLVLLEDLDEPWSNQSRRYRERVNRKRCAELFARSFGFFAGSRDRLGSLWPICRIVQSVIDID